MQHKSWKAVVIKENKVMSLKKKALQTTHMF